MAYLTESELQKLGFKYLGKNVKISDKAAIYNHEQIEIGDHSRIDDFCIVSGRVVIGQYCHITPMCLIAGGKPGIFIDDFSTFAYGVKVFSQSDDYTGESMTNSLIPEKFKKEVFKKIIIQKYTIVGAGSIIMPGVTVREGSSIGAMTLVVKDTQAWSINIGIPSKFMKPRSKKLLELAEIFKREM